LNELGKFTLGLLRNREVNRINQDSLRSFTRKVGAVQEVLTKELDDRTVAIGLFSYDLWSVTQQFKFQEVQEAIGTDLSQSATARNVWERIAIGVYESFVRQQNDGNFFIRCCIGTFCRRVCHPFSDGRRSIVNEYLGIPLIDIAVTLLISAKAFFS
jgi:hypothetical protein